MPGAEEQARQARTAGTPARLIREVDLGSFAMVMATGIVSGALHQAGWSRLSAALLAVAAVAFVVLAIASCWRALSYPARLRAEVSRLDRAFPSFAVVAACVVLGNGLATDGYQVVAAVLAGVALAAWLALTWLIPVRLLAWTRAHRGVLAPRPAAPRPRPVITTVNGTWYLWPVATQSLAIAATYLSFAGLVPEGIATALAIPVWSAGVVLYLATSAAVLLRLRRAPLGPAEARSPYWVAMGAASISVFAATGILRLTGAGPVAASLRAPVTDAAVALWVLATCLIPVLAAATTARRLRSPRRPRYWAGVWTAVFPLGMYSMASLQLGAVAGLPPVSDAGTAELAIAATAWALSFLLMVLAPVTRRTGVPAGSRGGAGPSLVPTGGSMPEVRARRAYEAPLPSDGRRVLVDRLWPRGLAKDTARLDEWLKAVAPSGELRRWYGHEPARFAEFRRRYTVELAEPERAGALARLRELASSGPLTLLTASRDLAHSQAAVLAQLLTGGLEEPEEPEQERGGDPACWLNLVCPRCGAMAEHEPPASCPRCGTAIPAG